MKTKDRLLKFLGILFIVIFSVISLSHSVFFIMAEVNYGYNKTAWQNYGYTGLIYNQNSFSELRYGLGNIKDNGCGAVAVYNILELENMSPDFPYIIKQFDLCGENVFGIGGTQPSKLISVLKRYGFNVNYSLNKSMFKDLAIKSNYAIYLYYGMSDFIPFGHYQLMYDYDGINFKTLNITGIYTFEEIVDIKNAGLEILIYIS